MGELRGIKVGQGWGVYERRKGREKNGRKGGIELESFILEKVGLV